MTLPIEARTDILYHAHGKPGINKGGQIVTRPKVYMHSHNLYSRPTGWRAMGLIEYKRMIRKGGTMVVVKAGEAKNPSNPHSVWDNYLRNTKHSPILCPFFAPQGVLWPIFNVYYDFIKLRKNPYVQKK